jgi:hypothetical protein
LPQNRSDRLDQFDLLASLSAGEQRLLERRGLLIVQPSHRVLAEHFIRGVNVLIDLLSRSVLAWLSCNNMQEKTATTTPLAGALQ